MGIGNYEEQVGHLLVIGERGALAELSRQLTAVVNRFGGGHEQMTEVERLLTEGLDFCRLGDLDEATHRLRLAVRPKWKSLEACELAYREAMGRIP